MLTRVSFSFPMEKRSDDKKDKGVASKPISGLLILLSRSVIQFCAKNCFYKTSVVEKNHENVGFLVSELVSGSRG